MLEQLPALEHRLAAADEGQGELPLRQDLHGPQVGRRGEVTVRAAEPAHALSPGHVGEHLGRSLPAGEAGAQPVGVGLGEPAAVVGVAVRPLHSQDGGVEDVEHFIAGDRVQEAGPGDQDRRQRACLLQQGGRGCELAYSTLPLSDPEVVGGQAGPAAKLLLRPVAAGRDLDQLQILPLLRRRVCLELGGGGQTERVEAGDSRAHPRRCSARTAISP